jgi:hypothetical protein
LKENIVEKTLGKAIDEIIEALKGLERDAQKAAVKASCEYLKIDLALGKTFSTSPAFEAPTISVSRPDHPISDIRSFKEQKQPQNAIEMAALVAFYLAEVSSGEEQKDTVQTEDMTKYFKQASFPLPARPDFILFNAKKAGYFEQTDRGTFRLNPVGYNLVAHNLPRDTSASFPRRPKRKRKSKAKGNPKGTK